MAGWADGAPRGACRVMLSRRVSGIPGAEGAPFEVWVLGRWWVDVLVVWDGCDEGGARRRDCFQDVSGGWSG